MAEQGSAGAGPGRADEGVDVGSKMKSTKQSKIAAEGLLSCSYPIGGR